MKCRLNVVIALGLLPAVASAGEKAHVVKNVVVYKEAGRFAGWPANNGIWSWGNEIVVGFTLGYPRTVQRKDGKIVTAYYFNDANQKERYIGATIWDLGPQPKAE